MLKVWGRLNSVNVQKVMVAVNELHLPHQRIEAGMQYGVNNTDAYRQMNPNQLIPTIDDDGFVLWESNAIVRYLLASYDRAGEFWPTDLKQRASADRWMDWSTNVLLNGINTAFWQLIRTPEPQRDNQVIAQAIDIAERAIDILEQTLADRWFLNGQSISAADIAVGPIMHRWFALPLQRRGRPATELWYQRLMQRPAFSRALPLPIT